MTQFDQLASMYALFFEQPGTGAGAPVEEDPATAATRLAREVEEHLRKVCDAIPAMEQQQARVDEMLERRLSSRTTQRLQACSEALTVLRETLERLGPEAMREAAQIAVCAKDSLTSSLEDPGVATFA